MPKQKNKRLFLIEYEKAKEWSAGKNIVNAIKPIDTVLVFKEKNSNGLSKGLTQMVDNMLKKQNVFLFEYNEGKFNDFFYEKVSEFVTDEIKNIYLLQMDDKHLNKVKELYPKKNVVKKNNFVLSDSKKIIDMAIDMDAGNNPIHKKENVIKNTTKDNEKVKKDKKVQKNKKAEPKQNKNANPLNEDMLFSSLTNALKDNPQKLEKVNRQASNVDKEELDEEIPVNASNNKGKRAPLKKMQPDTINIDLLSVNDIEKMIFNNRTKDNKFNIEYTDLDNSKAELVGFLYDRLIESVNSIIPNADELNLTVEQYWNLINTIIKSNDYIDFQESISVVLPGYQLDMTEETYSYLFDEAQYYAKVCNVLYDEDAWA